MFKKIEKQSATQENILSDSLWGRELSMFWVPWLHWQLHICFKTYLQTILNKHPSSEMKPYVHTECLFWN